MLIFLYFYFEKQVNFLWDTHLVANCDRASLILLFCTFGNLIGRGYSQVQYLQIKTTSQVQYLQIKATSQVQLEEGGGREGGGREGAGGVGRG